MRMDRLTIKAQEALQEAGAAAQERGHAEIGALHLLLALTSQSDAIVAPILEKLGSDPRAVTARTDERLAAMPRVSGGSELGMARGAVDILQSAEKAAKEFQDEYVSTEHLLLAIVRGKSE